MAQQDVFMAPGAYDADAENIRRRQAYAQALLQQGQQMTQGQMVGNHYVAPSWTQGLAGALKSYMGRKLDDQASEDAKVWSENRRMQDLNDAQLFSGALQGSPAKPSFEVPANEMDQQAYTMGPVAEKKPDPNEALRIALASRNPLIQAMGGKIMESQLGAIIPKTPKWEKYEKPDGQGGVISGFVDVNSSNPLATFQQGGQQPARMEFVNGRGVNPYTAQTSGAEIPKQADAPNPRTELLVDDGKGNLVPNKPLIEAKTAIAKAGASKITQKVDTKMGDSVAGQVGPIAKDSMIKAQGAVQMFDAADRIEKALDSNKVLAGPGASKIQTVRQFAQMVSGGNDEGIRQTRQVIKSLAQMSVEARKQLQGQGQVTENEAKAVAKADAGDIDDLTTGELRDLVALTKRAAHFAGKAHAQVLESISGNEGTRPTLPFYQVPNMDVLLKHNPKLPSIGGSSPVDALVDKYRSGGR